LVKQRRALPESTSLQQSDHLPLADGSKAVGMFNREQGTLKIIVDFKDIGLGETAGVLDLWARKDAGIFRGSYSTEVPEHGVVMLCVWE
jgi:alpha-galactosidase